jgi:polysaccharide deacetylase 2 family uncharacterized protein YibQ
MMDTMTKHKTNGMISKSLIIAWAALLVFVLGILTWMAIAPKPAIEVSEEVSNTIDLQLPEAMPVEKYILKDQETTDDSGGSASVSRPLVEHTKYGNIPQVSSSGKKALQEYAAKPTDLVEGKTKVVFIFSDLGRNEAILEKTPPSITLSYLPFSPELKDKISLARKKGHEILINIPMESADYPTTDSGPNTLLTGLPKEYNIDRVHWAMAQGHEFIGLMNLQGSLFLSSPQDLHPVLDEIAKRGLLFVESEASFRSQVSESAKTSHLPHVKSHFVLSESLTPAELHATLIRAEQMAKDGELIIIVAHASPLTTPLLLTWIRKAQEQNYVFLPVSQVAMMEKPHNEATS